MPKKLVSTAASNNNCICILREGDVPKFVEPTVANLKLHLPNLAEEMEAEFGKQALNAIAKAFGVATVSIATAVKQYPTSGVHTNPATPPPSIAVAPPQYEEHNGVD